MSVIQERVVAAGRGIRAERDLAESASDFYVLELLTARGDPDAGRLLAGLEERLAREFACYLDMAIGGELRYAIKHLGKEALPAELATRLAKAFQTVAGEDRRVKVVIRPYDFERSGWASL